MTRLPTVAAAIVGAGALVGSSVLTDAYARQPSPSLPKVQTQAKKYAVNGDLSVSGVLRVTKNLSVNNGRLYAHKGSQVWNGLVVTSGGIKTDSLAVSGPIQGANATLTGNLQAGAISANSLAIQNATTFAGDVTIQGKLNASNLSFNSLSVSGALNAGSLTSTGAITAPSVTTTGDINTGNGNVFANGITAKQINDQGPLVANSLSSTNGSTLRITGPVDFSGATVTGLGNTGGITGASLPSLAVGAGCSSSGSGSGPLYVCGNGRTAGIGVNNAGALIVGDIASSGSIAVTGQLQVAGQQGITTGTLSAPPTSSFNQPGTLTIQGSQINIAGNTTLQNGTDLSFSSASNSASHLQANNDTDVAGNLQVPFNSQVSTNTFSAGKTFIQPYNTAPIVVVTPSQDCGSGSRFWVGNVTAAGFTIFVGFASGSTIPNSGFCPFNYHVIGS